MERRPQRRRERRRRSRRAVQSEPRSSELGSAKCPTGQRSVCGPGRPRDRRWPTYRPVRYPAPASPSTTPRRREGGLENVSEGASVSSPIIASMFALAGGAHGVAYPAQTLYSHLGSPSLDDITEGGDGKCDGDLQLGVQRLDGPALTV